VKCSRATHGPFANTPKRVKLLLNKAALFLALAAFPRLCGGTVCSASDEGLGTGTAPAGTAPCRRPAFGCIRQISGSRHPRCVTGRAGRCRSPSARQLRFGGGRRHCPRSLGRHRLVRAGFAVPGRGVPVAGERAEPLRAPVPLPDPSAFCRCRPQIAARRSPPWRR